MPQMHRHRTLREHFKHPRDFRRILRNPQIGVVTFAWDETPETPNNPDVVVCFHPYGAERDLRLRVGTLEIRLAEDNPLSMGIVLGRRVWDTIANTDGWKLWTPQTETETP